MPGHTEFIEQWSHDVFRRVQSVRSAHPSGLETKCCRNWKLPLLAGAYDGGEQGLVSGHVRVPAAAMGRDTERNAPLPAVAHTGWKGIWLVT